MHNKEALGAGDPSGYGFMPAASKKAYGGLPVLEQLRTKPPAENKH